MFKFKKKILAGIILLVIVTLVVKYVSSRIYSFSGNNIKKIALDKRIFYAEVVSNPKKMQKGLGNRNYLCPSCAMLFEFSNSEKRAFWMKDMRFDLDIIWISKNRIVAIEKNISKNFSKTLKPQVSADYVLEINAGLVDNFNIELGSSVNF
jgi:uncharacterized membrane protein (UPF0127 family)